LLAVTAEAFNVLNDDAVDIDSATRTRNGTSGYVFEKPVRTRRFGRQWPIGLRRSF
jgi:hypothetical protein